MICNVSFFMNTNCYYHYHYTETITNEQLSIHVYDPSVGIILQNNKRQVKSKFYGYCTAQFHESRKYCKNDEIFLRHLENYFHRS